MKYSKAKKIISSLLSVAVIVVVAFFCIKYSPQIKEIITSQTARDAFIHYVQDSGIWGILAFLGLQLLQIIVAVIPGEPIELMAGALYGTVWGLIVCLFGVFVGSVIIYYVVKLLGAKSVDPQVLHKYRFLKDKRHIETILFLLFFIPGTPKDMLCYLGPFLPVKPMTFFLISTFARIPSIMTSTYGGANLANGRLLNAVVMFLITGAVALVGILTQDKLINWFNQRRKNFKERHSH